MCECLPRIILFLNNNFDHILCGGLCVALFYLSMRLQPYLIDVRRLLPPIMTGSSPVFTRLINSAIIVITSAGCSLIQLGLCCNHTCSCSSSHHHYFPECTYIIPIMLGRIYSWDLSHSRALLEGIDLTPMLSCQHVALSCTSYKSINKSLLRVSIIFSQWSSSIIYFVDKAHSGLIWNHTLFADNSMLFSHTLPSQSMTPCNRIA